MPQSEMRKGKVSHCSPLRTRPKDLRSRLHLLKILPLLNNTTWKSSFWIKCLWGTYPTLSCCFSRHTAIFPGIRMLCWHSSSPWFLPHDFVVFGGKVNSDISFIQCHFFLIDGFHFCWIMSPA